MRISDWSSDVCSSDLPLGISVRDAALGIHRVVAAQMVEGIRLVSIRQGFDAREFTLMPLGGRGGLHICALAAVLGTSRLLLPQHPGLLSGLCILMASVAHELTGRGSVWGRVGRAG